MGDFKFYAEKNQKLKDNFENHRRTTDFSAMKSNKSLIGTKSWMTFRSIRLRGRSQTQNVAYCMIPFVYMTFWKSKISGTEIRSVASGNGVGEGELQRGMRECGG